MDTAHCSTAPKKIRWPRFVGVPASHLPSASNPYDPVGLSSPRERRDVGVEP